MTLRDYQERSVRSVMSHFVDGSRTVLLVAPTGSGKTVMGSAVVRLALQKGRRVLWLCHRRELLHQAIESLNRVCGESVAGTRNSGRPVVVATVQSMVGKDAVDNIRLVVYDEAHHYVSDDWRQMAELYADTFSLGLTATPQRGDGRPLGDIFHQMVVSAHYSELIAQGHLVPCEVLRPDEHLGSDGIARSPVEAYTAHAAGGQAFVFANRIETSKQYAQAFIDAGIDGRHVAGNGGEYRARALADFRAGRCRVLSNVFVLTEGVDVPAASVCILARGCTTMGAYLQMVGRILRPAEGKTQALLIDLPGVSHIHGLPGTDVDYSLGGDGITAKSNDKPKPEAITRREATPPTIYSLELRRVYAGADTADDAKAKEWARLSAMVVSRDYSLSWAVTEYRKLFTHAPPQLALLPASIRQAEFLKLRRIASMRGYKPGYAMARYHDLFGVWPPRQWMAEA